MNKCFFLGKIIGDPILTNPYGSDLVNFTLEVEEYRRDKEGNKKRRTDILYCEAWDSAARTIHKYAYENDLLAVEALARNTEFPRDSEDIIFRVTNFKILPRDN